MKIFYNKYKSIINRVLASLGFILFVYLFVNYIFSYIAPFFFGIIVALCINPLVSFFEKCRLRRGIASALGVLAFLFAFVFIIVTIVGNLINQSYSILNSVLVYLQSLSAQIESLRSKFIDLLDFVPPMFRDTIMSIVPSILSAITNSITALKSDNPTNFVTLIPNFFMCLLITFISAFFFSKDKTLIMKSVVGRLPLAFREKCGSVKDGLLDALAGYLKAQTILMSITAVICVSGLFLSGYPYALFMGFLIALVDALPLFGGGIILLPWAAIQFLSKNFTFGACILAIYIVVLVTRQSLEPRILGKQIGIHPLITLLSIFVGLKVFGGLGFFLGPAVVVTVKVLMSSQTEKIPR
ncbi:sporulation integral membrane protein YtvI [Clostridia bacterium]|nr:sporulation integral membrane protein YtvI [Clostridia bacterium]